MAATSEVEKALETILGEYRDSFEGKDYAAENDDHDLLMDVFGITPQLKRENRQYWGRELGMCWQLIVTELCRNTVSDFGPAIKIGKDVPCDLTVGKTAIDTKYRIGSGDAGTLKKFKTYGSLLIQHGYEPLQLIMRNDNLAAAITACRTGGWRVIMGEETFKYLNELTGFNVQAFFMKRAGAFSIER